VKTPLRSSLGRVAATVLALAAVGCNNDDLTGLNRNPNSPDEATPEFLFANATEATISRVFGTGLHMDITGLWVQHFAEHRFSTEDRYTISDGAISGHWSGFYAGPLQDLQETIQLAEEADRPAAAAQARVLQSWTFQVMTDLWGDIGYSDALRGRDASAGNTPTFDPQAEVYASLLTTLREAHDDLTGGGALTSADLLYGGDLEQWQKFTNSLRMRMAMRMSEVDATTARTEFTAALAAGPFTSNADNAMLEYIEGGSNVNPIFDYERSRDDHSVSKTIVDTLKSFADPRLPVYAKPTAAGTYVGMPNGSTTQPALTAVSHIGAYFASAASPAPVMTYAEVLFLQAEAAERGWITGDAAALYRDAIRASMQQYGIATGAIDTYLAQAKVQYAGGAAGLRQIALQKWIALYGNSVEAYAEWRRTGYPQLEAGPDALNDGLIPIRLPYPQREESLNADNLQQAIDRQGGASLNDRIWWMQP
jgi:hypothetical protein